MGILGFWDFFIFQEGLGSKKARVSLVKPSPPVAKKAQQATTGPSQPTHSQPADPPPPSGQNPPFPGKNIGLETKQAEEMTREGVSARTLGVTQKRTLPILPIQWPENDENMGASLGGTEVEEGSWKVGGGDETKRRKGVSPNGEPIFEWTSMSSPPFSPTPTPFPSPSYTSASYILALAAPEAGGIKQKREGPAVHHSCRERERNGPNTRGCHL